MEAALSKLGRQPVHFPDCCAGISWPLMEVLASRLPRHPGLVLSVGSGSGLLEAMLLHATDHHVNICGVEVAAAVNRHLPPQRVLRVPRSASIHADAMLASSLLFVYPRSAALIARYLDFIDGALEQLVWLGHRNDWPDAKIIVMRSFERLQLVAGDGLPEYELLAIATVPKRPKLPQPV